MGYFESVCMILFDPERFPRDSFIPEKERTAIVFVAFGTSDPSGMQVLEGIDRLARERYRDQDVFWAFRSRRVRENLARQGVQAMDLDEVLAALSRCGYRSVVLQNLSVAADAVGGVDFCGFRGEVGPSLLNSSNDVAQVATILSADIDPLVPSVVVVHGSETPSPFEERLLELAECLESRFPRLVLASLHGRPGPKALEKVRPWIRSGLSVQFIPLMIVVGTHMHRDVLSGRPGSWRHFLQGAQYECAPPLGAREAILSIYFDHLDQALVRLKSFTSAV